MVIENNHSGTTEIISCQHIFEDTAGEQEFICTQIILRKGNTYYWARSGHRDEESARDDIGNVEHVELPSKILWPPIPDNATLAPPISFVQDEYYVKCPSLHFSANPPRETDNVADLLLHEASIYEVLEKAPHPNIVRYFGCIVDQGTIRGFCLKKYDMELLEYIDEKGPGEHHRRCWEQIRNAVRHLHSLGLVHCDLNPWNIMMDGDVPVIIDFDSCHKEGQKRNLKGGQPEWGDDNSKFAERRIDLRGLEKLWQFMKQGDLNGNDWPSREDGEVKADGEDREKNDRNDEEDIADGEREKDGENEEDS